MTTFVVLDYISFFYIAAFAIAISIGYMKLARWLNITDQPIGRSSHSASTITGLGVVFPVTILFASLIVRSTPPIGPFFIIALFALSMISFIDDIMFVKHSVRFVFQIFALVLMIIELPLGDNLTSLIPIYAATIVFGIGVINAYNFMDGINGMLGLNLLATLLCLVLLNDILPVKNGEPLQFIDSKILFSVVIADIVFLFYNFRRKAKSFAGDVGAISIGFIVLSLVYQLVVTTQNYSYLLLFIVFGIDAGVTVFYKIILRENIFVPHRDFLFKKLVHVAKMKHLRVSALYASVQFLIGLTAVLFFRNIPKSSQIAVLFTSIVGLITAYIYFRNKLTKKRHEKPISRDGDGNLKATYKRIS